MDGSATGKGGETETEEGLMHWGQGETETLEGDELGACTDSVQAV